MKVTLAALVALVAVALTAATGNAAQPKPKPWQWTTADAQRNLVAAAEQLQLPLRDATFNPDTPTVVKNCRGLGKASAGRFTSFRCSMKMRTINKDPVVRGMKPIWIKVRRQGRGQVCVSLVGLRAIPAGCLKSTGTRSSTITEFEAGATLLRWLKDWDEQQNLPSSQVRDHQKLYGYGAGYFEFGWQVVDRFDHSVPLQSHTGVAIFSGAWVYPPGGGCIGTCPGLTVTQTS